MMKKLSRAQAVWLKHVKAWQEKKCAGKTYADLHNIKLQYLYNWKSYFKAEGYLDDQKLTQFTQLTVNHSYPVPVRISFANGAQVEIPATTDIGTILQIVSQTGSPK